MEKQINQNSLENIRRNNIWKVLLLMLASGGVVSDESGFLSKKTAEKLLEKVLEDGGFTFDENKYSFLKNKEGFVVSLSGFEAKYTKKDFSEKDILEYFKLHKNDMKSEDIYFGGWYNSEDGKVYLDLSLICKSLGEAVSEAKKAGQDSIYNLATGEVIKVPY